MKDELENPTILTILVHHEKHCTRFSKPPKYRDGEYWVTGKGDETAIYISEHLKFPVYLQFEGNVPITAVGFAEQPPVPEHSKEGRCGGCFSLVTGVEETKAVSPLILNSGDDPKDGYHFGLWLGKQQIEIDPRIYNHGEPQGRKLAWWRRIFRWIFRRGW